uniref:Uncharacterized protein n=1 Tax=Romanomermis culicivorax TaxID=13658 RepID=A0A915JM27_ROMCU
MQIKELDGQQRRHLHRSGAFDLSEHRAKGPGGSLLTASSGRPARESSMFFRNSRHGFIIQRF